jgi:hypothetical protein
LSALGRLLAVTVLSPWGRFWPKAVIDDIEKSANSIAAFCLRFQSVDATHWLNRSAGVSKSNVFLGCAFNCLATAFSSGLSDGVKVIIRPEVNHHELLGFDTDTDFPADHSS